MRQSKRRSPAACLCVALLFGFWLHGESLAAAEDAAAFFRGKVLRIIVGYAPGGGYDSYARLIAPHLEAKLGARIIVENQPGGSGFNALNNLMRDRGDGLRMLLLNGESALLSTLVDQGGLRFDLRKLAYLGRVSYENRTLVARRGTRYERIDGFLGTAKPVFFGAGGRIDSMGDPASILCDALGIACKLVTGFQGATDAALALQRGEIDALVTSESQTDYLIKSAPLAAVALLSTNKSALMPDVPRLFDIVRLPPERTEWLRFRAKVADFGRILVVPGDTPADRIALLSNAVAAVLTDPAVQDEGARTNRPIAYAPAAESREVLDGIFASVNAKQQAVIRKLLLTAY
jgi:tripartite-type tricarboxylate transporter receptor subunit TctC